MKNPVRIRWTFEVARSAPVLAPSHHHDSWVLHGFTLDMAWNLAIPIVLEVDGPSKIRALGYWMHSKSFCTSQDASVNPWISMLSFQYTFDLTPFIVRRLLAHLEVLTLDPPSPLLLRPTRTKDQKKPSGTPRSPSPGSDNAPPPAASRPERRSL